MIAPPPGTRAPAGPLRIVSIGGGTGLSTLLQGLKPFAKTGDVDITAIVTVTDDGGSSGRLRREFDILPPGDIRNCMVALSEDAGLLSRLFQYRFSNGRGLRGHSFGNLFLTALTHVTGDFPHAVKVSSEVLAIYGRIFPSTSQNVGLRAHVAGGKIVEGETKISRSRRRILRLELTPTPVKPLKEALDAIANADLISMGPGSLFTSVIPNLLVEGVSRAIARSRATKIYFSNLMWQPWETMSFSAYDHVKAILDHAQRPVLDAVILNTTPISRTQRALYASQKVFPVENDLPRIVELGINCIGRPLLARGEKVRHNSQAIGAIAMELAHAARQRSLAPTQSI